VELIRRGIGGPLIKRVRPCVSSRSRQRRESTKEGRREYAKGSLRRPSPFFPKHAIFNPAPECERHFDAAGIYANDFVISRNEDLFVRPRSLSVLNICVLSLLLCLSLSRPQLARLFPGGMQVIIALYRAVSRVDRRDLRVQRVKLRNDSASV